MDKYHLPPEITDKKHMPLQITATIITFFTLLSSGLTAMIALIVVRFIKDDFFIRLAPMTLIIIAFIISTIIGTAITLFVSRHYFKPLDDLIKSQKKIAKGDFSARVETPRSEAPESGNILSELVSGFNAMAEELGSTEMFRNDFINNFSHEFKTPIVSIKGFAKQLANDNLDEQQRKEYIDIIISESDRLSTMSTNILLLTKFENQQIVTDKTEFYLDEQLRKCILLLEKQWTKKNLDLELNLGEVKYYSNEEMLSHVWLNIIGNAIKFTPDNGKITVKCSQDSSAVTVKISDTGIGMDDKTVKRIFDKFYQGDTSHTMKGNGLGLPLSKRVIDLCAGKITVKSQPDRGTTFIVKLPQTANTRN